MMKILFLLPVFFIAGCVETAMNRSTIESNPLGAEAGNFGYSYAGVNCVTGVKAYRTKEQYCIGIQSEAFNNNCALEQRRNRFEKDCTGFGFRWLESAKCDFSIVKGTSVLEKKSICAGRMESLNYDMVPNRSGEELFNRAYLVGVDLEAGEAFSARIEIRDRTGFVIQNYDLESDASAMRETALPTNNLKMRVACYRTNACPK